MLNGPKIEREITRALAKQFEKELDSQFDRKVGPSGKEWEWTKKGRPFDMNNTIADSISLTVNGNEIDISSSKPYTGFLNYGTYKMPAREIWPEENAYSNKKSIENIIDEVMMKELGAVNDT